MKTILLLLLVSCTAAFGQGRNFQPRTAATNSLASGGGGGPDTWYHASTTSDSSEAGDATTYVSESITVASGGTATMARIEISIRSSDTAVKMALYDGSNNLLASGTATATTTGYLQVPFDTPAVISAGSYRLAYEAAGNGISFGVLGTTGSTYRYQSLTYASFPENPRSSGIAFDTRTVNMGVYVD